MTPEDAATYRVDRTGWAPGPWDTEPDRVDWTHAGLPCFVLRNHHGAWCGYVGVAAGHPAYGLGYGDVDVEVHGGLTYAEKCSPPICHVPAPGEPDEVYWFGFDCGHAFDIMPGMDATLRIAHAASGQTPPVRQHFDCLPDEVYRPLAYAQEETNRLADQLAAVVVNKNPLPE